MKISASVRFEIINDAYCRDTGYLRPGKSIGSGRDANDNENRERFENWCATRMVASLVERIAELERDIPA